VNSIIIDPKKSVGEYAGVNLADPAGNLPKPKDIRSRGAAHLARRRVMVLGFVSGESANFPSDRNTDTSGAD
jgi:hypothetical protein